MIEAYTQWLVVADAVTDCGCDEDNGVGCAVQAHRCWTRPTQAAAAKHAVNNDDTHDDEGRSWR